MEFEHHGWHVMPTGDLREHEPTPDCWCEPEEDDKEPGVWLHNSADERERFEDGRRKPS